MPIFELDGFSVVRFRRQAIDAAVYESEIEQLIWDNLEDITGDNLFRLARQPKVQAGGVPDIVALDSSGRVVVIEIKRDFDRGQLAQCLEYAGWARRTSLDELATMYHGGASSFWEDWMEFTGSSTPVLVTADPRLVLVARSFHRRTSDALEFLLQHRLPVKVLQVAFYVDDKSSRRFLDVEWEVEPEAGGSVTTDLVGGTDEPAADYREVTLAEVAKALQTPCTLVWNRPRKDEKYTAELYADGRIVLPDGREFTSPSRAAVASADVASYDGWYAWRVGDGGPTLHEVRQQIAAGSAG